MKGNRPRTGRMLGTALAGRPDPDIHAGWHCGTVSFLDGNAWLPRAERWYGPGSRPTSRPSDTGEANMPWASAGIETMVLCQDVE